MRVVACCAHNRDDSEGGMRCCECEVCEWGDPQPVEYVDEAGHGYCLFHAPANHKMVDGCPHLSVAAFNAYVFHRIDQVIATSRKSEATSLCNMEGTIFLGSIDFSAYTSGKQFPNITFRGAAFSAETSFYNANFGEKANFIGTIFGVGASFERAIFGKEATFRCAYFDGMANFRGAAFGVGAKFSEAEFGEGANFAGATFGNELHFAGARFHEEANFAKATFGNETNFLGAEFGKEACFAGAIFGNDLNFYAATFGEGVDFGNATFGNDLNFYAATFGEGVNFGNATFGNYSGFSGATFGGRVDFLEATFKGEAGFNGVRFAGSVSFHESRFQETAKFIRARFGGEAQFHEVKAEERSLWLHALNAASLAHLSFSSMETDLFSFKGCDWPEKLLPEANDPRDVKACEELYRSLKQMAAAEHDQPMVSKWHYREKLMALEKLQGDPNWRPWKSITWWYFKCSCFGEDPIQAVKFLCFIVSLFFSVLCALKVWETGWSPQPAWDKIAEIPVETIALIPLVKSGVAVDPSSGSLFVPIKRFFVSLMQIVISVQIALFAFALRNRFRR